MYVCIHYVYVYIIINYCTRNHICGRCRTRSTYPSRASGSTLLLSNSLFYFRKVHFTVYLQLV